MMILAALTLVSGLHWYTDLDEAKAAAQRQDKPILSLRLLGNLDEELSCANSRFFRTILYSNPQIAAEMRDHFILHWKSVRPVPKVTIDFGDGRKITTTITGNSIHYLLAPDGHVIDALPGMYTPEAFLAALREFSWGRTPLSGRPLDSAANAARANEGVRYHSAIDAARLTASKAIVETPLLTNLSGGSKLQVMTLAREDDVVIDESSLRVIREKSRPKTDEEFAEMIATLKATLAADTRLNENELRPAIRRWIAEGMTDVEALNERVYAELFLTPSSDPWLGLLPNDVYTGLDNDGVTVTPTAPADTHAHRLSHAPAQSSRSRR